MIARLMQVWIKIGGLMAVAIVLLLIGAYLQATGSVDFTFLARW